MLLSALIISLGLFSLTYTYTLSQPTCSVASPNTNQSPIDISSLQTYFLEEKTFRLLNNNYDASINTTWTYFPTEQAIGVKSEKDNLGSIIFVKDWGMYNFILNKILFRVGVEHSVDGVKYDAEMQLIHTFDANYYTPGKRIDLGINYLVISFFFKKTDNANPLASELFNYMNLAGYAAGTNTTMIKDIKLNDIVQHQPAYLYEGTLTFPNCQKSLWYVNSQYHLIRQSDFDNLVAATKKMTGFNATNQNVRNQFVGNATVYRNFNDITKFVPRVTMMNYMSGHMISGNFIMMIIILLALFI
jgi:carbonic anhydrase